MNLTRQPEKGVLVVRGILFALSLSFPFQLLAYDHRLCDTPWVRNLGAVGYQFPMSDGTSLCIRKFNAKEEKGIIILIHGVLEHGLRHQYFAQHFSQKGFSVYIPDLRGHGVSDGKRGDTPHFMAFVRDLRETTEMIDKSSFNKPIFIVGHSMGGLIAFLYGAKSKRIPPTVKGFVLSSPALSVKTTWLDDLLGWAFYRKTLDGFTKDIGVKSTMLSEDPAEVLRHQLDKTRFSKVTVRLGRGLVLASRETLNLAPQFKHPIFLVQSSSDDLVDVKGNLEVLRRVSTVKKFELRYSNTKHEIFNSSPENRLKVFRDVESFINAQIPNEGQDVAR